MVLYYKASHRDLDDLTKEEKKEDAEDENKEETEEESKKESWDELVSEAPDPIEVKSIEDEEEGLEDSQDQEEKEEDDNSSPEASEENPLKISESRKVTAAKGWIKWEVGSWAQAPQCSG